MLGKYFSHNCTLLPLEQAKISIDNLSFTYGFGVYEALKVRKQVIHFLEKHLDRLFHSASQIGLQLQYSPQEISRAILELAGSLQEESYNIKILAVGKELYIFAINPLYPPKSFYTQGVAVITQSGERLFPQAKTLNMLQSYLAYTKAKAAQAYDALLIDQKGYIREGTRTNFFYTYGEVVYTAPPEKVLQGVTKITLLETLATSGISVQERVLHKDELHQFEGFFLTSTSSKILPISRIDNTEVDIPPIIRRIIDMYDLFLADYRNSKTSPILHKTGRGNSST